MSSLYYLISSLPSLKFGDKPPFSDDKFLSLCAACLNSAKIRELKSVALTPAITARKFENETARKWSEWDTCLRNRIIRLRKPAFHADATTFQKAEKDYFSEIDKLVQEAFSISDPLNREKSIDSARWKKLDDLESGHVFDFEKLVVYRLKLLLLEKWAAKKTDQGKKNFEGIISSFSVNKQ